MVPMRRFEYPSARSVAKSRTFSSTERLMLVRITSIPTKTATAVARSSITIMTETTSLTCFERSRFASTLPTNSTS